MERWVYLLVTILQLIEKTTPFLEKAGVPTPRLDLELLLAHVLKLRRLDLYLQHDRILSPQELDALRPLVKRRSEREPLQYLTGFVPFCDLELEVGPNVLIPRPETEVLVESALSKIPCNVPFRVLDLGTGSGAIILAIVHARPQVEGIAVDLSSTALEVAKRNAGRTGAAARVEFRHGDLFSALGSEERFHAIVSNPPYIPSGQIAMLQPEVSRFDPHLALDGGADGMDIIRKIVSFAPSFLHPEGFLMMEMGHDQSQAVRKLFEPDHWTESGIIFDYQGVPRIVWGTAKDVRILSNVPS